MKKRVLSIFAAGCLVTALMSVTAFANPAEDGVAPDSGGESTLGAGGTYDDASQEVKDVYDAYGAVRNALASNDVETLKSAAEDFEAVLDTYNELTEEQFGELAALLGVTVDEAYGMILSDWIDVNVILETYEIYQAYLTDKNVKTALDLSNQYNALAEDDDYLKLVKGFIPDLDTMYSDTRNHMPSPEAMSVCDAYVNLQNALDSWMISELEAAAEGFEAVLDTYNELTEEQFGELAALLGVTVDEAYGMILSDWIDTNIILEAEKLYQAYLADPSAETASEFIAQYDAIFNDPDYVDEQLRERVGSFIFDIDDVYSEALAMVSSGSTESGDDAQGESELAQAGDDLTATSLAGLMTICFGGLVVCVFALRRKSVF